MKFFKRDIYFLSLLAIFAVSIIGGPFTFAETALELEKNIQARTVELKNLEREAERIKIELSKTGAEKESLNRELSMINGERKSLENNISQTRGKINLLDSEIEQTEYKIEDYSKNIQRQSSFLETSLRRIYNYESFSLFEILMQKKSLSEFFTSRDQYIKLQQPIIEHTDLLRTNKFNLSLDKQVLTEKQKTLEREKDKFNDQKSIVVGEENKKKQVLEQTKNKESVFQQNLKKTLATIDALDKEISSFESKLKFMLNKKALPSKGSAIMDWPLSYVLVTQRFGKTTDSGRLYTSGSHSGMDFRAAVGTPVFAVADGTVLGTGDTDVSCPKASFGKWVFIEHDIGLSTTSGHLSLIKSIQGQKVKKGDLIAYTGNSGSSGGPHLHYEIRDAYSRPMNPMLFGLEIPDTKDPSVTSVLAYPVSDDATVNQSSEPVKLRLIKQKDGSYKTEKISAYGKIGFGIATTDQQNGAYNKNGVYRIKTTYNGKPKIDIKFEKFSFDETRYLNRYIDYTYFKEHKIKIQKLFRQTNNPLSIITQEDDNGFVNVADGFSWSLS